MKELNAATQLALSEVCCQFASEEDQKRIFDLIQAEPKPDKILTYKTIGG